MKENRGGQNLEERIKFIDDKTGGLGKKRDLKKDLKILNKSF